MRTCDKCKHGEVKGDDFYCLEAKVKIYRKYALNSSCCDAFNESEKPSFSQVALSKCHEVNPDNPQAVAEAISDLLEALKMTMSYLESFRDDWQEGEEMVYHHAEHAVSKAEGK